MLASSDKTRVEMFRYGKHMMGVQGHPEYTKDILLQLIDRLLQRSYIEVLDHISLRHTSSEKMNEYVKTGQVRLGQTTNAFITFF